MKRFLSATVAVALILISTGTQSKPKMTLPIDAPDWQQLWDYADPGMREKLERRLKKNKLWGRLIDRQKMAVGLVDLRDLTRPRYAEVNGNIMMYAASLPKIAILLAAFDAIDKGRLERSPAVNRDLNNMIRRSSNEAATRMIDRVGGLRGVNAVLTDPRYLFYDIHRGGGLWMGKRYARQGRRIPDPISGTSHGATVEQVCRFYYELLGGRLISHEASAEMLQILSEPALHHKFVKTLERSSVPMNRLYRKSGTWKQWHADSVLVDGSIWRRYILVAMVENPMGETIMQELVGAVEEVLQATGGTDDFPIGN